MKKVQIPDVYIQGKRKALTPKRRLELFIERQGSCVECGGPIDATKDRWIVEHLIPIADHQSDEDANAWDNLGVTHDKCAREKTSREAKSRTKLRKAALSHYGAKQKDGFNTNRSGKFKRKMDGTVVCRETGKVIGKKGS